MSAADIVTGFGIGQGAASIYTAVKATQVAKVATVIAATSAQEIFAATGSMHIASAVFTQVKSAALYDLAMATLPNVMAVTTTLKNAAISSGAALGLASEIATGTIANLPIVKASATAIGVAKGEVFVIGGIAFSVQAAIIMGLISVVVIAGVTYWVYTGSKDKSIEIKEGAPDIDEKMLDDFCTREF